MLLNFLVGNIVAYHTCQTKEKNFNIVISTRKLQISITMNPKYFILIITFLFASPLLADTDEIATAHIKKITGNVAESFMDRYYISNGWEKLRREVGVHIVPKFYLGTYCQEKLHFNN